MRVRIHIGLDFDGLHTFAWETSDADGAVEVPRATLERWATEREAFKVAYLRWKHVVEEVDEALYRAEQRRATATQPTATLRAAAEPAGEAVALAAIVRAKKNPASPGR